MRQWIKNIIDSLENSTKPEFLHPTIPRQLTEIDDRHLKLIEEAKASLPRPICTLLDALSQVKTDLCTDSCRHRVNYESQFISELDSAVSYALDSINFLNEERARIIKDCSILGSDVYLKEVEYFGKASPEDWPNMLLEKSRSLRKKVEDALLINAQRRPLEIPQQPFISITKVDEAVQESRDVLKRLKDLSSGTPITSYFQPKTNVGEVITEISVLPQPNIRKTADLTELLTCLDLRRRILAHVETNKKEREILLDDATKTCIQGLSGALRNLKKKEYRLVESNIALKEADTKIQSEIKYMLATLTVDRQCMDKALRAIKLKVESIEELSRRDILTSLLLQLSQWRLALKNLF